MRGFGKAGLTLAVALLLGAPLSADEFDPELEDLARRLQAAEQRIMQLESSDSGLVRLPDGAGTPRVDDSAAPHDSAHAAAPDSFFRRPLFRLGGVNRLERPWLVYSESDDDEEFGLREAGPREPTFEIHGRIHLDSWSFADDSEGIHWFENPDTGVDPENRVFFRRTRLEMGGDLFHNMLWRMQLDFHSPEDGEFKDVYIGFRYLPILQTVLVGIQKRPLGLDHLNSSRFNVFIERPLVVEAFNEDARRLGVMAYGVSDDEVYHWRYGAFILENIFDDGEYIGDSLQGSANARLSSSPWYDECSDGRGYFHWAVAGMVARPDGDAHPFDTNENEGRFRTRSELRSDRRWLDTGRIPGAEWYEIAGLESILNIGALQIVGEYQTSWMQRDDVTPGTGPDLFFHGGYVYAAWMLTGEHVPYDRGSGTIDRVEPFENFFLVDRCDGECGRGWGAWQVALRYSHLDLTDQDIRGGVGDNVTLGLVWYFNPFANLQFNAIYGEIRDREPVAGFDAGHFTAIGTRLRCEF